MATRVVREDSSAGVLAIFAIVLLLIVGFVLYNQGYFGGNSTDINVELPSGQAITGSVSR